MPSCVFRLSVLVSSRACTLVLIIVTTRVVVRVVPMRSTIARVMLIVVMSLISMHSTVGPTELLLLLLLRTNPIGKTTKFYSVLEVYTFLSTEAL